MLAADTPDYVEQRNIIQELTLEKHIRQSTGGIHEMCGEQEPALLVA
jgi:hypothetical protein